jgi:hypothetical protein
MEPFFLDRDQTRSYGVRHAGRQMLRSDFTEKYTGLARKLIATNCDTNSQKRSDNRRRCSVMQKALKIGGGPVTSRGRWCGILTHLYGDAGWYPSRECR